MFFLNICSTTLISQSKYIDGVIGTQTDWLIGVKWAVVGYLSNMQIANYWSGLIIIMIYII